MEVSTSLKCEGLTLHFGILSSSVLPMGRWYRKCLEFRAQPQLRVTYDKAIIQRGRGLEENCQGSAEDVLCKWVDQRARGPLPNSACSSVQYCSLKSALRPNTLLVLRERKSEGGEACCVALASLELRELCLPLRLKYWNSVHVLPRPFGNPGFALATRID